MRTTLNLPDEASEAIAQLTAVHGTQTLAVTRAVLDAAARLQARNDLVDLVTEWGPFTPEEVAAADATLAGLGLPDVEYSTRTMDDGDVFHEWLCGCGDSGRGHASRAGAVKDYHQHLTNNDH